MEDIFAIAKLVTGLEPGDTLPEDNRELTPDEWEKALELFSEAGIL